MDDDGAALARSSRPGGDPHPRHEGRPHGHPAAFLAIFFVWPLANILGRGLSPGAVADVLRDPGPARGGLVHALAGGASAPCSRWSSACRWPSSSPATSSPAAAAARGHDGGLRAAHGRGRRGVPRPARRDRWHGTVLAIVVAHVFFNYAVVVRTVAALWAHLDPRLEEAARMLGASRWRAFTRGHAPAAPAGHRRRRVDHVPVHVHVVRGRAAAGRPAAPDARGGDLPPHHPVARPGHGRRARPPPAGLPRRAAVVVDPLAGAAIDGAAPARRRRGPRTGPADAGWAVLAPTWRCSPCSSGCPWRRLVERSFATPNGYGLDWYRALGRPGPGGGRLVDPLGAVRLSIAYAVTRPPSRSASACARRSRSPAGAESGARWTPG